LAFTQVLPQGLSCVPELTDAAVKRYKPGKTRREIPDSKATGLYLVIQTTGAKSWALRFRRPDQRSAKLTLGPLDTSAEPADEPVVGGPLTLGMARELAAKIHRERKRGIDVVAEEKAKKERKRREHSERIANTFGAAVIDFCHAYKPDRQHRLRYWRYMTRVLGLAYPPNGGAPEIAKGSLADTWASKPLAEINDVDVHTVVRDARDHGIPGMGKYNKGKSDARGRAMHSALSLLFKWLLDERWPGVTSNPCLLVSRPKRAAVRDRVLKPEELRWFWAATERIGEPFGALLRLLLLTGCRRDEVAAMRWHELSEDGMTWIIPSSRAKNWRELVVPLPSLARDLLGSVKRVGNEFVFTTDGKVPISSFSRVKDRLDGLMLKAAKEEAKAAGRDSDAVTITLWRIHDLRRTAATGMAGIGIQPHVIEAVLNHVSGAKAGVAGTYNKYAYLPEKTFALEQWAAHVEGITAEPTNDVVPIAKVSSP
jgi:integrase